MALFLYKDKNSYRNSTEVIQNEAIFVKNNDMKKLIYSLFALLFINSSFAQTSFDGSEIGIELVASASNLGGSVGGDLKYAAILNENWAVGPSFRLQRTWSNNFGTKFGYSIYGGGLFAHYRLKNTLYGGAEFEMLRCPLNYVNINPNRNWLATLFIGGGFSRDFNHKIRINAGVFYDVINAANSPFRSSYVLKIKDQNGQVQKILPVIYRISFFFPIGK